MNARLLKLVAAVPAGEKLSIGAFARQLDATQAVVIAALEALVRKGRLDPRSLRPPAHSPGRGGSQTGRLSDDVPAAEVLAEIEAFLARSGMSRTGFSLTVLRGRANLNRLRDKRAIRAKTAARIRAFIADYHHDIEPLAAGSAAAGVDEEAARQAKTAASSPSPTWSDEFQAQLAKVAAGAGLVEHRPLRRPDPDRTLGGVTGDIL